MVLNVFAFDEVPAAGSGMGAARPADRKTAIEGIAGRYQVPANVLLALNEAGSPDPEADARDISTAVAAGQTVDQALAAKVGDPARSQLVLNRAYDIADEMYPEPPPPPLEPSFGRDTFSTAAAGTVSGVGSLVRGVGQGIAVAADAVNDTLVNPVARAITGEDLLAPAPNLLSGAADSIQRRAQAFGDDNISQEYRDDMAGSRPTGELLSPSTWSFGDDPSLKGYAAQAANVFGSMLPVVVAGAMTGGLGAGVVGGAQSGGAGVEGAQAAIDQMAAEIGEDGRSRLEVESGVYRDFIAQGMDATAALEATKAEAARMAFLFTAPVGALGGAATQKIVSGAVGGAVRGNMAQRVGASAAIGATEEGTQEVIEGVAQRAGMNAGAGTDESLAEDTFGNFLLGAMGGGPVGALGGIAKPDNPPAPTPEPPLQPVPASRQLPPPALITPPPSAYQQNTPAEAAAGVMPPSPNTPPRTQAMAADLSPMAPALPQGPISRAAAAAPDLTPVPAPAAPLTRFPDQKPGAQVRIVDPETGVIHDAVFVREDPQGPVLRIEGNEITVTPQEFDQARLAARAADESATRAAGGKVKPRAQSVAPAKPPAPGSLSQQAMPTQRPPERVPEAPVTPVQAIKNMAAIRSIAKERGWNSDLSARYSKLEAIAKSGGQNVTAATTAADAGTGLRRTSQDDTAASSDGNPQRDVQPERDTSGPGPLAGSVATNPVDDRSAASKPPADLTPSTGPTIADIRERAAVLRGVPQDSPPVVDGVSLKWDAKEKGFIFSRKHKDRVQAAVDGGSITAKPVGDQGAIVLPIEGRGADVLRNDWQRYRDAGASWDFDSYQPHVTITYDGADMDLSSVEPYKGVVEFGPERQKPLDLSKGPKTKEKTTRKPEASGILSVLSQEKQDRAADLKARLAAKARNQLSAGVDPEYLSLGGELVALYIEAGTKRFAQMLRDFAESTGLSMKEAQAPMRVAYNHIRDEMDLSGQDIEGMDSADQVMAEIRKALAAEATDAPKKDVPPASTEQPKPAIVEAQKTQEAPDDSPADASDGGARPGKGARDPEPGQGEAGGIRDLFGQDSDRGGRGAERSGDRPEPDSDGAGNRVSRGAGSSLGPNADRATNHVIPAGGLDLARGEKTRARESIEALRVLRAVQAEGRPATTDERAALAKYGGAGTLAGTLPRSNGTIKFPDLAGEIDGLLSADEKATLSRTSQYAFYTAEPALRGMWALAQQLGFTGGRVYEPGMGVGGFAGTIPADIRSATKYQGLELDLVTAQIAKALYPNHAITQGDFIKTPLAQNFYDLVIGNPPFAGTQIKADPAYPQGFMIHDYFFAKSLDSVRPGGLLMFITSAGTMNKQNPEARDYLADRADLVGAIRLPNTAFKENGTEVTTDIIILRKRLTGEKEANAAWRKSTKVSLPDKDGVMEEVFVNQYFIDNPAMILGEQGRYDTLTAGARVGVRPLPGSDLRIDLAKAFRAFPEKIMSAATASVELGAVDATSPETKRGGFYLKDGVLHQFDGNAGTPVAKRGGDDMSGMSKGDYERIVALIPIKMALRDVYAADLDQKDASAARKALNEAYDGFVEKYGPINMETRQERRPSRVQLEGIRQRQAEDARSIGDEYDIGSFDGGALIASGMSMAKVAEARAAAMLEPGYREGTFDPDQVPDNVIVKRPNIDPMMGNASRMGDQEAYRLRAIEKFDSVTGQAAKTAVFSENALRKPASPKINSPEDALLYTLAQDGRIDMAKVALLAGVSREAVERDLEGKVFLNPASGEFETRSKYLSGNVRIKLAQAQDAARTNPALIPNVRALSDVQPEPIPASEIRVPIGAHWFDADIYTQYAKSKGLRFRASFKPTLGMWTTDGDERGALATSDYGTADYPFPDLMRAVMNNKPLKVTRSRRNQDGTTETWIDDEATQAAKDKAAELQSDFTQWLWSDEARSAMLEDAYNAKFNAEVAPTYDGAYLTTPGVNAAWSWRPHQTAVIARILQSGSTYMAHTVGAGKTSAMIGAGMEAKRLGLARKPMYVVPNHMLEQFTKEFYEQYPLANIAVADESRFHTNRRKEFVADIAVNDYDAIILTHSAFELIPSSEAAVARAVEDMLRDIREVYEELSTNEKGADQAILGSIMSIAGTLGLNTKAITEGKVSTRKKIEQLLEAAEQRISAEVSTRGKDQVFNFDEIGVDMLFVDEAHLFRKLSFATQNGNIKGIDPAGSQASMDLFIKTRTLESVNPGRGLVLASGTPITNTMAELYTISRFIQPQALDARGVSSFDAWAATFGQTESALEQQPDGSYKQVSRFAKFVNTPELSLMVRQQMDVVTGADLEKYVARPSIKGGKRNVVVVEASNEAKAYQQALAARMERIANRKGPVSKGDDILLSVINDGRLAAIDMRLVDPDSMGHGSKLEAMVQKVYRNWKEGAKTPFYGVKKEGGYTDEPILTGPSTQIVFSTLGVNPSKHNPGFSVHRFIRSELIRLGVPASDIIVADEIDSHAKRQRAFNDMNEGTKRILIGSKTLFTGVNAQRRLAAIHNLDPLWYPADDEQRNGRGIRQGNMNREIEINDYTTKGTYDATMWQMMGRKASFIEAFYRGDPSIREMEDMGEASQYEQAKAMTTADPRVQVLADLRNERDTLQRRKSAAGSQRRRLEQEIRSAERVADLYEAEIPPWEVAAEKVTDTRGDAFTATINGEAFTKRAEAGEKLIDLADKALADPEAPKEQTVMQLGGLPVELHVSHIAMIAALKVRATPDALVDAGFSADPVGLIRRIEGSVQGVADTPAKLRAEVAMQRKKAKDAKDGIGRLKAFAQQAELDAVTEKVDALEAELLADSAPAKSGAVDPETKESRQLARPDPIPDSKVRGITIALRAEMARAGLEGKVSAQLVRSIQSISLGDAIGAYTTGTGNIRVSMKAGERNALGVLRHEMIHALRDASLWGKPYGLFTKAEWQGLVKAARADADIVAWVNEAYPDEGPSVHSEEMVAEMYRLWADKRHARHPVAKVLGKIRDFFMGLAGAHRTEGFTEAADVFAAIANGTIGGRGPNGADGEKNPTLTNRAKEMRADLMAGLTKGSGRMKGAGGFVAGLGRNWRNPSEWLTDAMSGANGYNLLGLVPGRALYAELGKTLTAAKAYLKEQESMDALRNQWHSRSDEVAQSWMKMRRGNPEANEAFMDLLHRTTLAGIDPSKPDTWKHALDGAARREVSKFGDLASDWAKDVMQQIANHERAYARLSRMFDALPADFQKMYGTLRKEYDQMGDAFEQAVLDNMENATKIAIKRAERAYNKEVRRITDDGLEGAERDDAMERAEAALNSVKKRGGWGSKARMMALRKQFESNRLKGPYFPLARFGDFFVTARDAEGKVVSFSRFDSEKAQMAEVRRLKEKGLNVQHGAMATEGALKEQVDPNFVADVEKMLSEAGASSQVMDMVWQRWLETLPDQSIRTSKIHRKGREGFNADAFRAFGKHMFHGAHQLARLKHGLLMEEHLNDAREQAQIADDPNRAGLIVNEMTRRHEFAMNPQTNSTLATASSIAFIWYLGVSPAAALANLFQTTVLGPGIMAAKYGKAGMSGASVELAKAMKDFASGRGEAARASSLTDDERLAMAEAYRRGTADKSQAHDLASVADTGIEYSARRERIMKMIGYFFHHAERMNREVTFLAAYRLGRQEGLSHEDAVDKSASTTWTIHFDYQNSMRPRFMQNDLGRALTMFRQYTVNMLWRLFRDTHQATRGQTAADRKEARTQLIGITLSMMAHAGIKGTWGYGIVMMLLGVFFPGGSDDAEEWLQDSLLMEGDSTGVAAWNWAMGAALQGVPGQALQISLSERIGMPNLWFRGPGADLEGRDLYTHYVGEVIGPAPAIIGGFFMAAGEAFDDPWRAAETAVPKWIRDVMKAARYGWEGVTTRNGDPIIEGVSLYQMLVQANGFTPAQVAERYEINTRLKNEEKRLLDERRGIQQDAGDLIREGAPLSDDVIAQIRQWNMDYPEYPITPQTIRQSVNARVRASERNEFGIQLNPKLNDRLRGELPPSIYN